MVKIFDGYDRIIRCSDDGCWNLDIREVVVIDAVRFEIGLSIRVIRVLAQQQIRHAPYGVALQNVVEIILPRKKALFAGQGFFPLFHEIGQQKGVAVDSVRGLVRVENRADADDLFQGTDTVVAYAFGDSQGKIAPQGKTCKKHRCVV